MTLPVDLDELEARFFKTEEYNRSIGPLVVELRVAREVIEEIRAIAYGRNWMTGIGLGPHSSLSDMHVTDMKQIRDALDKVVK